MLFKTNICIIYVFIYIYLEEDKTKDEEKNCFEKEVNTDPWPGYKYSGKLRPHYPLVWAQHMSINNTASECKGT